MRARYLLGGIAARIALACLLVSATTILVIAVGVLGFGQSAFQNLMTEHGTSAAAAHQMFQQTISAFFLGATLLAGLVSVLFAVLLARRLSHPLDEIGRAARRVAEGHYHARVPRAGPEEVASLADSFNQMAESLEEQELMRREFITNAAHELRTPLTNLQGYLEALRDGVVAPSPETFASLHEEADRLVRLARSLDALAAGDAGAATGLVDLDLVQAITSAVEIAKPAFERAAIRLHVDLPERLPARGNPDHLAQVLANLLQNALRYTPSGGRVTVGVEARPGTALTHIINTGDGIPAADLPYIFERFYRVEKSRDRARGGAGIGLAIVKQLVESGGGRVGVESHTGLTRFWFSVPA
jgi:signal transduction histidine kinase